MYPYAQVKEQFHRQLNERRALNQTEKNSLPYRAVYYDNLYHTVDDIWF